MILSMFDRGHSCGLYFLPLYFYAIVFFLYEEIWSVNLDFLRFLLNEVRWGHSINRCRPRWYILKWGEGAFSPQKYKGGREIEKTRMTNFNCCVDVKHILGHFQYCLSDLLLVMPFLLTIPNPWMSSCHRVNDSEMENIVQIDVKLKSRREMRRVRFTFFAEHARRSAKS